MRGFLGLWISASFLPKNCFFERARPMKECFFTAIGLVLILEGMPWFLSPMKMKMTLAQLWSLSETTLRILGFFAMMGGLLTVYLARG